MTGKQKFQILKNAYSREHLMEQAKKKGISWEESNEEGINWMRFSNAMVHYLNAGGDFDMDEDNPELIQAMLDQYKQLRDLHKQSMIPHIRAAMAKIYADKNDKSLQPTDCLQEAHEHLAANGGQIWAEKLASLSHFNRQIKKLQDKLNSITENMQ